MQLSHQEEETSWEDHGCIHIEDSEGVELTRHEDFQRNPFFRNKEERTAQVIAQLEKNSPTAHGPNKQLLEATVAAPEAGASPA